jgi:hypothetical protein
MHDPVNPACCDNPSLTRIWYFTGDGGVRCTNCETSWGVSLSDQIAAMASDLIDDWSVTPYARGEVLNANKRALKRSVDNLTQTTTDN